ncbi:dirigent protein 6 [Prosopis cineraria]|uniref:dirigent protein 6 n=1 Tax=Prosopis cineraria TaxID=364024 RepID=UPI00240F49F8|nr:dirigent protein 6 [Prosopis cineraria]
MLSRVLFCTAFSLATVVVILLALLSPASHKKSHPRAWLDLSLYIQKPHIPPSNSRPQLGDKGGAFIFHRVLTEGPDHNSRIVGKAQGFIIPTQQFALSAFNVIYLTFETPERSGSLSVQAREAGDKGSEEFTVVGGTGSFAFARGVAVFTGTDMGSREVDASYYVRLQLEFPNQSPKTPG